MVLGQLVKTNCNYGAKTCMHSPQRNKTNTDAQSAKHVCMNEGYRQVLVPLPLYYLLTCNAIYTQAPSRQCLHLYNMLHVKLIC